MEGYVLVHAEVGATRRVADAMLRVDCPANSSRLTQLDCDAIRRRAAEQPGPGTGKVQFLMPPRPPLVVP